MHACRLSFDVLSQTEVAYIAIHLASKKMFKDKVSKSVIIDDVFAVTRQMIDLVWRISDLILGMILNYMRFYYIFRRLHYNLRSRKSLLTDIPVSDALTYDDYGVINNLGQKKLQKSQWHEVTIYWHLH